ncbi:MAG: hypothetical protein IJU44_12615 [Kiritimatiellae bacterium]|nr:hypothetical protein [Kiritimatiellia bacterium]
MNDAKEKEQEFDELDAVIAAALSDESAWNVPRAGFEDRCAARVEEILNAGKARRSFWSFGNTPFLKLAAVLVVMLAISAILFNVGSDAGQPEPASVEEAECTLPTGNDIGSRCERMVNFLGKEVSRREATKYLASVCAAGGF